MKATAVPSTAKIVPVAVSTIIAKTETRINTQVSSPAPDNSGKNMTQFEAILGRHSAAFATAHEAECACLEAASALGHTNFARVTSDANSYRVLTW